MAGAVETIAGYGSHQRMLVKYLMQAPQGSLIVEMGCGHYSTPIIHEIAKARGLRFKVFFSDDGWQAHMRRHLPEVEFIKVNGWQKWRMEEPAFLVMLDNEELCVNRFLHIDRLMPMARHILIHDADTYDKRGIPLRPRYSGEYYDLHVPHTMVIDCQMPQGGGVPVPAPLAVDVDETRQNAPQTAGAASFRVAVVCAYVPGGDYDLHYLEYIQRLADGVRRHAPEGTPFFCVTYMDLSSVVGVTPIQPRNDFKGWHIKAEVFNPELWDGFDRVLYVDLDTVLCGPLAGILSNPAEFGMLRDFYRPKNRETGVVWFTPTKSGSLYRRFVQQNPSKQNPDARIVDIWMKQNGINPVILQDLYPIGSYKVDIVNGRNSAENFSIVCFHGLPRPHHVGWSLDPASAQAAKANRGSKIQPVEPIWKGEPVWIIGGGPSVAALDLSLLNGKHVIGVNDAFKFPCTDICYFGDQAWCGVHKEELIQWGKDIYTTSCAQVPFVRHLNVEPFGISKSPDSLAWNLNSGYAAINLACHLGASRINLVGFDMSFGKNGESNYHPNIRTVRQNTYQCFLRSSARLVKGLAQHFPAVRVVNCNPDSCLDAFEKMPFIQAVNEDSTPVTSA